MSVNQLRQLQRLGQSVWLDQISRRWFDDGTLQGFVEIDGVRGVTSNPSIFDAAISAGGGDYDAELKVLALQGQEAGTIYDAMTLADIRAACDVFLPVFHDSGGRDGFVSHEVSPDLAYDMWGTIHEARRLWHEIGRPNAMIKVPATHEGVRAGRQCLIDGINVNFTLMFSLVHYDEVAEAYLAALEARASAGEDVSGVASVASFFISRVDSHVDGLLDARLAREDASADAARMRQLRGTAAVANGKRAYRRYQQLFDSGRFGALEAKGARTQRVLWASTSTKNPEYSDVKYVDELVGPHTVNTIPLSTLNLYRDRGKPRSVLAEDVTAADEVVNDLSLFGIDLDDVGEVLSKKGVEAFQTSLRQVLATIEERRAEFAGD